ncbi:Na+/H+ antiporter NhaC family protein [Marinoscillum sp. MHG1-6]|uniref:Na+/H+ antiporter NhaC family protein n=1 Tax=Marinoscillum sp. MHG1-6 TaxID=2959627 RepID=UPI002158116A|nr:Na+/H+ antiporter NhaC family protein [Marinoscillum sp. MHG1-6]
MTEFGILSIFPPIIAIILAIQTKQVIPAILTGLFLGYLIIFGWNPISGALGTIDGLVDVFKSAGNTRTILFTLLIGALIQLIKTSNGVHGFVNLLQNKIERSSRPKPKLQLYSALTGFLIFIESNISILTVGTLFGPLFKKFGISKVRLAYIADSSSAPSCILFPANAWGAYIIGLLALYDHLPPFKTLIYSIPFNFYPILTLLMVAFVSSTNKTIGPMKKFEVIASYETTEAKSQIPVTTGKASNMLIPLLIMIFSMPLFMIYTGYSPDVTGSTIERLWAYIGEASGSSSVLYAVSLAVIVAGIMYAFQKLLNLKGFIEESFKGMNEMLSMAILMVLAFALGNLCKELETGQYVAEVTQAWLTPQLAPAVIFATSCFIAFSTGTSWGTFAIMISIGIPLAQNLDLNIYLALAAVLGGGVFGDHCSPISDTTLIASMATETDHIDHVKTQLPYALITGGASFVLYLIFGFLLA